MDKITDESGGQLQFRVFPKDSLVATADMWQGTAAGVVDISYAFRYDTVKTDFIRYVGYMMTGSKSGEWGQRLQYDLWDKFPEFRAEWSANKIITLASSSPGHLHFIDKKVITLDDFKGLQIRVSGAADADTVTALGATPEFFGMGETYEALQKNIVDGYVGASETLQNWRLAEVTKYTPLVGVRQATGFSLYMNWDTYNNLPADLQKVIDDNIPWAKQTIQEMLDGIEAPALVFAEKEHGTSFTYRRQPTWSNGWLFLNRYTRNG